MPTEHEKGSAEGVICPWCDFAHQEIDDYFLPTDENPIWGQCKACGKSFEVVKTDENTFVTSKSTKDE
jgi:hypothetical protein